MNESEKIFKDGWRLLKDKLRSRNLTFTECQIATNVLVKAAEQEERPCERCKRVVPLSADHIVPVRVLLELGFDAKTLFDGDNIQMYCIACNHWKAGRLDIANPKTVPLLEKYLTLLKETSNHV